MLVVLVYAVHQDFWNWRRALPLVFGFLPIGLAYQAGFSLLSCLLMLVLVRLAWPDRLEAEAEGREGGEDPGA